MKDICFCHLLSCLLPLLGQKACLEEVLGKGNPTPKLAYVLDEEEKVNGKSEELRSQDR